jgi:hypothetical protein
MGVECISSFSTMTWRTAAVMSAASCGSEPGLQTRSAPVIPGEGVAPDQSVPKVDSIADTSASWRSITTKSLVVEYSFAVRFPVMMAELASSTVIVF